MRLEGSLRLIDLDSCVSYVDIQYGVAKTDSGYIPPELLYMIDGVAGIRRYSINDNMEVVWDRELYDLVVAHPSQDMWSLGAILYYMCTGKTLFWTDSAENIDAENLIDLYHWRSEYKSNKVSKVSDVMARNLVSQLLSKLFDKRPSATRVLFHPFISNRAVARMPGDEPEFDLFLSYRVNSDFKHVELLYNLLTKKRLKVWWDKVCLEPGMPWEEGFCNGLAKSRAFVPLLSREAIKHPTIDNQNFEKLTQDSRCDNVFLEHRLALELRAMGLIEKIYPVMIGDKQGGQYSAYFQSGCHPSAPDVYVESVEAKVREHLDRQGLGAPIESNVTVKKVLSSIMSNQGGFIEGMDEVAFVNVINTILDMLRHVDHGEECMI